MLPNLFRYDHYRSLRWAVLISLLVVALGLPGCHNTCVTVISNPPQGTVQVKAGDPPPTCKATVSTSAIRVEMSPAPTCATCPAASPVQHIFITVNGVSARTSAEPDAHARDWKELAPQLAERPVQVDLLAPPAQPDAIAFGEATVPAGVYRQIRLQLLTKPQSGDPVLERNVCGNAGFHCLVMADGRIEPLALENDAAIIPAERIEGGFLRLLPDTQTTLRIRFQAAASLVTPGAEGARLLPTFTAATKSQ